MTRTPAEIADRVDPSAAANWLQQCATFFERRATEERSEDIDWQASVANATTARRIADLLRTEISRALGGAVGDRYAEGYAAAREDAAKIVESSQETDSNTERGKHLTPRFEHNRAGLAFAAGIRAMKPQGGEQQENAK